MIVAKQAQLIKPGNFEPDNHWYPKALNATIHPLVNFFLHLSQDRIIKRYCHLHPKVKASRLEEVLKYRPKHFIWAGADLMHVTNADGKRQMVVIENNSCPSGQKSMPLTDDNQEQGGYKLLMERTIRPILKSKKRTVQGALAVVYDKNPMETVGYAHAMADAFQEPVYCVEYYDNDPEPSVRFKDNIMHVQDEHGAWIPIRASFRYVTQKPWNRIPIASKTHVFNPVVACLAGGRNKMVASKLMIFSTEN